MAIEKVTKGYYFLKNIHSIRVYYLSGEKKGNKWIDLVCHAPEWTSLLWTCIPKESELNRCEYSETNPINVYF